MAFAGAFDPSPLELGQKGVCPSELWATAGWEERRPAAEDALVPRVGEGGLPTSRSATGGAGRRG